MSLDYRVLQEAAEWFARLESDTDDAAEREAWAAWVRQPEHARAWQKVQRISGRFAPLSAHPAGRAAGGMLQQRTPSRRQALKLLSLVCGGAALGLAGGRLPWQDWSADLRTGVGEVRETRLADGSRLWLNTDSAADAGFDGAVRQLALYRGEVLVEAVDEARPLLLRSREGQLRVTQAARFSVRQRDGSTQLSVFSGMVDIQPDDSGLGRGVGAGQQVGFSANRIGPPAPVQAGQQAWSRGILLADNLRLVEFLAELARYRHGYLGCDPRIAELRVVGAFPLADSDRVLDALAATLPVRVQRRMSWWVSLEPSGAA